MSQVREMGKIVYEQPGNEVDGSCHNYTVRKGQCKIKPENNFNCI
jgi:hypothetical protein